VSWDAPLRPRRPRQPQQPQQPQQRRTDHCSPRFQFRQHALDARSPSSTTGCWRQRPFAGLTPADSIHLSIRCCGEAGELTPEHVPPTRISAVRTRPGGHPPSNQRQCGQVAFKLGLQR
jgi:hypothetical protein